MDELEKAGAKGTFFLVGDNATKYPEIVKQTLDRGHRIANHTYHHVKGWKISTEKYLSEISACDEVIGEQGLFRPPFGQVNFKAIAKILKDKEIIMWDVLTKDYLKIQNTKRAQKRIQRDTTAGSIAVFHDSDKAEKNLKALLPEYLKFLKKEGYKMEVL